MRHIDCNYFRTSFSNHFGTLALLIFLACPGQRVVRAEAPPKNNPERNFEAFWRLFNRYYAHFETRGLDWEQQYQRFKPMVTGKTTDEQLLAILHDMVAPLKDGHIVISPTGDLPASAKYARFHREFPTKALQAQFHQVTLDYLQKNGFGAFTKFKSEPYQIGGYCRSDDYGYLQLNGFGGMPLATFARQLDEMISDFADVKGLIVDIRINGGGSPAYVQALVGRLTQVRRLVGYGRTRYGRTRYGRTRYGGTRYGGTRYGRTRYGGTRYGGTRYGGTRYGEQDKDYSPWTPYHIAPQGTRQLIKPTVLLTSGATISAGDHCALYLRELPYVKLLGEPTNGIFSAMLGKTLPNGWEISLSSGQTVSSRRISYEGKGVPVDTLITHHREDMLQGRDPVLQNAFHFLQRQQNILQQRTICFEQIALNYYATNVLSNKADNNITVYSTGLVEEDATLLSPFAQKCRSLQSVAQSPGVHNRMEAEQAADSAFHYQNTQRRFYVRLQSPVRAKRGRLFAKRNARRLTVAHHITIDDRQYVRLHLSQGGWKGETILVVIDNEGRVVEHCALVYDYLSGQFDN